MGSRGAAAWAARAGPCQDPGDCWLMDGIQTERSGECGDVLMDWDQAVTATLFRARASVYRSAN